MRIPVCKTVTCYDDITRLDLLSHIRIHIFKYVLGQNIGVKYSFIEKFRGHYIAINTDIISEFPTLTMVYQRHCNLPLFLLSGHRMAVKYLHVPDRIMIYFLADQQFFLLSPMQQPSRLKPDKSWLLSFPFFLDHFDLSLRY